MALRSYDLFDTLITRVVKRPKDVFRLMSSSRHIEYRVPMLSKLLPFEFVRPLSERIARRLSDREDISIFDIYRVLGLVLKNPAKILRMELRLEAACIVPVPAMVSEARTWIASGERVCVITDMYLPLGFLKRIVRNHVGDLTVYSSGDKGYTKASGKIFGIVAKCEGVEFSEINHTGDNIWSDVRVPRSLGISSVHTPINFEGRSPSVLDCLKSSDNIDTFSDIGFSLAGPTAAAMALLLEEERRRRGVRRLVFFARDMYLVQHAFERLSDFKEHTYCRISRSALYQAVWHRPYGFEYLFEGVETCKELFDRVALPCPPEYSDQHPSQAKAAVKRLLHSPEFHELGEKRRSEMVDYLAANGFTDDAVIIDLGWRGSIQNCVNSILNLERSLPGIYFGTNTSDRDKSGLYFQGRAPSYRYYLVMQAISFFEYFLTEPVRSLKTVKQSGSGFDFVFAEDESDSQINARAEIEAGAKQYINLMAPLLRVVDPAPIEICRALDKNFKIHLKMPDKAWVDALKKFTHSGGAGGSAVSGIIGDNNSPKLWNLLKAPWKGGYLVLHDMQDQFLYRFLASWPGFIVYDSLKRFVRFLRATARRFDLGAKKL